jgi:hypothetical protein
MTGISLNLPKAFFRGESVVRGMKGEGVKIKCSSTQQK